MSFDLNDDIRERFEALEKRISDLEKVCSTAFQLSLGAMRSWAVPAENPIGPPLIPGVTFDSAHEISRSAIVIGAGWTDAEMAKEVAPWTPVERGKEVGPWPVPPAPKKPTREFNIAGRTRRPHHVQFSQIKIRPDQTKTMSIVQQSPAEIAGKIEVPKGVGTNYEIEWKTDGAIGARYPDRAPMTIAVTNTGRTDMLFRGTLKVYTWELPKRNK